jgi:hypothetical protein
MPEGEYMPETTEHTHISEQMSQAVGREVARRVSYPVTESDIRRWALATYYPDRPPRLYYDAEYAAGTEHGGIVAPLDFNPFAWLSAAPGFAELDVALNDPDRTEKLLGIREPGLNFILNGGLVAHYGVRMRPGDVITSVIRLTGYSERDGRFGRMLFTTLEDTWSNQIGNVVKRLTTSLIRY